MRFTIQKDYLVRGVQDVMKAVSSRTTIPILTGIKVVATEEGVTLTGSDADISIESFIPVEEDGKEIVEIAQSGSIVLLLHGMARVASFDGGVLTRGKKGRDASCLL